MSATLPDGWEDDLALTQQAVWQLLCAAVDAPDDPLRTPVLGTVSLLGAEPAPSLRTVVLRAADAASGRLSFHPDARSTKAAELVRNPQAALLFYAPALKLQIRVEGAVSLHLGDATAREQFDRIAAAAPHTLLPYLGAAPGTPLEGLPPVVTRRNWRAADLAPAWPCFAWGVLVPRRIETLVLDPRGHRRIRIDRGGTQWTAQWIAA
ncbi:MAG TPA: pyridoxamine 5'-phosphate oxidase family protein [Burkholderiaceae bacterium]|nr:pyridoxamine 5'-phosphate oxidase family protein [Burkholderiaceae bacterium]